MSDYYPDPPMPLFDAARRLKAAAELNAQHPSIGPSLARAAAAPPRTAGATAAEACTAKAERVAGFDTDAAKATILEALRTAAQPLSGEELVDRCQRAGIVPHDARAFGSVFGCLARNGLIETVGFTTRAKGHGTAGGRLWRATSAAR